MCMSLSPLVLAVAIVIVGLPLVSHVSGRSNWPWTHVEE